MEIFSQIVQRIVKEQALIIGPLAWEQASKISGLIVDIPGKKVEVKDTNKAKDIIDTLVKSYEELFGLASREVCRDAVKDLIADLAENEVPSRLKS